MVLPSSSIWWAFTVSSRSHSMALTCRYQKQMRRERLSGPGLPQGFKGHRKLREGEALCVGHTRHIPYPSGQRGNVSKNSLPATRVRMETTSMLRRAWPERAGTIHSQRPDLPPPCMNEAPQTRPTLNIAAHPLDCPDIWQPHG